MKGAYLCVAAGLVAKLSWTLITPWTLAHQAPLSVGFPRQESWSGLAFLFLVDLSNPGIELTSLMPPALAGSFFTTLATWEARFKMDLDKLRSNLPNGSENPESASVF